MTMAGKATPNMYLRCEREQHGWSRAYVAKQIGLADPKTVGRWERGISSPNSHFRQKLCQLFEKEADELGLLHTSMRSSYEPSANQFSSDQIFAHLYPRTPLYDLAIPPSGRTAFVGRTEQLYDLKQRLCARKRFSSMALYGLPGVGKTSLVTELVDDQDVHTYFRDGMLWASIGPKPDLPGLLRRWGTLLGIVVDREKLASTQDWLEAIHTAIGRLHLLLVIDDVWEIEDALSLKIGGSHCTYLLTTRFPKIAIQFAGREAVRVCELSEEDGLTLLAQFVPSLVTHEPGTLRALVQSVGALPLILTLMGKYLHLQTYNGQPRRLQAALDYLHSPEERLRITEPQAPLERHTNLPAGISLSLQAVIEASDAVLDETMRCAFYALSVFPAKPNSFSEEAALKVCAASWEVLDKLTDFGLLESCEPGRYTLHPTLTDYASTKHLDRTVEERMVEYFACYIQKYQTDDEMQALEQHNVFAALRIARDRGIHFVAQNKEEILLPPVPMENCYISCNPRVCRRGVKA